MSIIYFRASNSGLDQPKSGPSDANTELTSSAIAKRSIGLLAILLVGCAISGSSSVSHRLTLRECLADFELPELPKSQVSTTHDELSDAPTFHVGEIVEQIYNIDFSSKVRILYPYQVEKIHSSGDSDDIRYTIVRLFDGLRLEKLPEATLRQYLPYEIDTMAACNVGGHGMAQQLLLPCFVQEYMNEAKEYRVRIDGEDHNLSIDMMLRHS